MKLKKLNLSEIQNEFPEIEKNERTLFIDHEQICFMIVFLLFIAFGSVNSVAQSRTKAWNIADNDTICLAAKHQYNISGSVFKAMDPQYIATRNGLTKQIVHSEKILKFELNSFYECFISDGVGRNVNAINAARLWNYYINDKLMLYDSRILVSTLMLNAIDKVEYIAKDTLHYVIDCYSAQMKEPPSKNNQVSAIRIRIRDVSKVTIPNESTLYLLDSTIITRKIFDALNPVYIRSLQRITAKEQLAKYGKKNIREVVIIETFTHKEVIAPDIFTHEDIDKNDVLLVNGIQLPLLAEYALNRHFFKDELVCSFNELSYELQKKYPDKRSVTIISIE